MSTKTTPTTKLKNENEQLRSQVETLSGHINQLQRRLGGLRYHVITESANGNDLGPRDFVRLVDNIIDEA